MYMCVYVCGETKKYIAAKYSSAESVYIWKFSILKDSKCTNFNMAMNVVLLAVCFHIFSCVSVDWWVVCSCGSLTWKNWEWESESFSKCRIYRNPYYVTGSKHKVYFYMGQIQNMDVVESIITWLHCPIRFLKLFNLFRCLSIFASGTSESWILFFQNFLLYRPLWNI